LLTAYSGIAQIGPGIIASLAWWRTTAWGVAAGSIVGLLLVGIPEVSTWWQHISNIEPGFLAMIVNTVVLVAVSLLTRAPSRGHIAVGIPETGVKAPAPAVAATTTVER
jgi:solute:Na+ symporter, SSS family